MHIISYIPYSSFRSSCWWGTGNWYYK